MRTDLLLKTIECAQNLCALRASVNFDFVAKANEIKENLDGALFNLSKKLKELTEEK